MALIERLLPWRRLEALGILGMNKRNGDYIAAYNRRSLYPLVDDKLKTKHLAVTNDVAVPKLYAVIEIEKQIRTISKQLEQYNDFVVKPSHGSGGEGILVITSRVQGGYRKSSGEIISEQVFKHHTSNILSGMYKNGTGARVITVELFNAGGQGRRHFIKALVTIFGFNAAFGDKNILRCGTHLP